MMRYLKLLVKIVKTFRRVPNRLLKVVNLRVSNNQAPPTGPQTFSHVTRAVDSTGKVIKIKKKKEG